MYTRTIQGIVQLDHERALHLSNKYKDLTFLFEQNDEPNAGQLFVIKDGIETLASGEGGGGGPSATDVFPNGQIQHNDESSLLVAGAINYVNVMGTWELPQPQPENAGQLISIVHTVGAGNLVTIDPAGYNYRMNSYSYDTTGQEDSLILYSDGTEWFVQSTSIAEYIAPPTPPVSNVSLTTIQKQSGIQTITASAFKDDVFPGGYTVYAAGIYQFSVYCQSTCATGLNSRFYLIPRIDDNNVSGGKIYGGDSSGYMSDTYIVTLRLNAGQNFNVRIFNVNNQPLNINSATIDVLAL